MLTRASFALAGALSLFMALGCGSPMMQVPKGPQASQVVLAPSLGPVDTTQPRVLYNPIQGIACGDNALLQAIWDMKRLTGVDGYIEVVIEQTGADAERCVTVTAYPFTYGTAPRAISLRDDGKTGTAGRTGGTMAIAPAPAQTFECAPACTKFGTHAGTTALIRRVVTERCETRCATGDSAYQQCIASARMAEDVKRCNALPAAR